MADSDLRPGHTPKSPAKPTVWLAVFAIHIVGAVGWWWLLPHRFPWLHPRWWSNDVCPWLLLALAAAGAFGIERQRPALARAALLAIAAGWMAALASAVALFPVSSQAFRTPLAAGVVGLWGVYWMRSGTMPRPGRVPLVGIVAVAVVLGGLLPWTQRAPLPQTLPLDERNWPAPPPDARARPSSLWSDTDRVQVLTATGEVIARFGSLAVNVGPLLAFESRSPDGCWTVFAPRGSRESPPPRLVGLQAAEHSLSLGFQGDPPHLLRVNSSPSDGGTRTLCKIDVLSQLAAPVYSHLNSYATVTIRGHKQLTLGFSPCSNVHVPAEPADYPIGRPSRFAYLDARGQFHVVEASSGEKGPFRNLASGPLARTDPLKISFFDNGQPVANIVFENWASQASVDLSPTAGWGVPMNSIEFSRTGDAPTADVEIWISLAATSVGRGWDSVGHQAGTYSNHMRLEDMRFDP